MHQATPIYVGVQRTSTFFLLYKAKTENLHSFSFVISANNQKTKTMKKILLFSATVAAFLFSSCNSCNRNNQQGMAIESETDSIFWINDSTIGDMQTFVFEGTSPMYNDAVADVVLTVSTISLNNDGTYTVTTDFIDEGLATQTDNGEAIILMSTQNDSTATLIELVSANDYPTISFMMLEDSSLVKVGNNGKPASMHSNHHLKVKK